MYFGKVMTTFGEIGFGAVCIAVDDETKGPGGAQVGVGVITVEQLSKIFTVDVFAQSRGRAGKGGYQRKPNHQIRFNLLGV